MTRLHKECNRRSHHNISPACPLYLMVQELFPVHISDIDFFQYPKRRKRSIMSTCPV